jgi:DNA modification methylase
MLTDWPSASNGPSVISDMGGLPPTMAVSLPWELPPEPIMATKNTLFYGDNLSILREKVADESVDLIYLDPPFNSKQDYNVIFRERGGKRSTSQELVFGDTWEWSPKADEVCKELIEGGGPLSEVIRAFRTFLGTSDMMAYLTMMAPRLRELHRVLKPTGSLYLHCDPTASHYLKMLMDAVFGPQFFRNEIIWKRTTAHSSAKRFAPVHDVLLYFSKTKACTWNPARIAYSQDYLDKYYRFDDGDGHLYWRADLCAAGVRHGESGKPWRGIDPGAKGMHWKFTISKLQELDAEGRIYWPKRGTVPQYKRYRKELKGKAVADIWDDIDRINPVGGERLGYPTQKPAALLDRIIRASSNEGDLVLDPFCGCGTAVEVAETLRRRWIGIDVTHLATAIIKQRLASAFGLSVFKSVKVIGEPVNPAEAEALAREDKFGFQCWAVGRLGAPPIEQRRGADRGIDGRIYFHDDTGAPKQIIISVKAGEHVGPAFVRELRGVIERERTEMGIFVCVKEPTAEMRREAAGAGTYRSINGTFPRLQIVTVPDIFADKPLNIPGRLNPYAPKRVASVRPMAEQLRLLP